MKDDDSAPADSQGASHSHDAFISYSRRDKAFAVALEKALEHYKPPRNLDVAQRHLRIFRDENDFTAGDYERVLNENLRSSRRLIVICSPNARKSKFVDEEIRHFVQAKGSSVDLIPVLIAGVPNNDAGPEQEAEKAFPQALCDVMQMPLAISYLGFSAGAGKIRSGSFEGPWYTILANILGVTRAAVEERERKRQARTRNAWIAALASLATVFAALAIWAFVSRQEARAQRDAAIAGKLVMQSRAILERAQAGTPDVALLLSAASYRLKPTNEAYGGLQYALRATTPLLRVVRLSGSVLAISADMRTAVTNTGNTLQLWDTDTGEARGAPLQGHTSAVASVAFSPDGRVLASVSFDKTLRAWDAATGQPIGSPLLGHTDAVESVAFSPDGRLLASAGLDKALRMWDATTWQPLGVVLHGHKGPVLTMAFSPDGKILATGGFDGTVHLWDTATWQHSGAPLQGHLTAVTCLAFSADGKTLASGSTDRDVRLWDVTNGLPRGAPLEGHTDQVLGLAFSPDGKALASASDDGTVRRWDTESGRPYDVALRGHTSGVSTVAFSRDGRKLLSGSRDQTLITWGVAMNPPAGVRLQARTSSVMMSTGFNPDRSIVATGSADGAL